MDLSVSVSVLEGGGREEEGGGEGERERGREGERERGREIKEGEGGWLAACTLFLPSMQCTHTTHTSSAHPIGPDLCECIQHLTQQWWTILQYDILV